MIANYEALLDKYAELVIKVGLNIREGQRLWINTPIESAPFSRLLLKHAYQLGASYVHLAWSDSESGLLRYQYASMEALRQYPDWEIEGLAGRWQHGSGHAEWRMGLLNRSNPKTQRSRGRLYRFFIVSLYRFWHNENSIGLIIPFMMKARPM